MKHRLILFFTLLTMCSPFVLSATASAAGSQTNDEQTGGIKIRAKARLPENQYNQEVTYFDLLVAPEDKQEVFIDITNITSEPVTIAASLNNAVTNNNGVIEYSPTSSQTNQSKGLKLTDFAQLSDTDFVIPGEESFELKVTLDMKNKKFDGIVLGGVYLRQTDDEKESQGNIKHVFNTELAISLRQNEMIVPEEISMGTIGVGLVNSRTFFKADFINKNALIVADAELKVKVYRRSGNELLFEKTIDKMKMAPSTQMTLLIPTEGQRLSAGDYVIKATMKTSNNTYEFSEDMTISQEEAKELNEGDVSIEEDNMLLYIVIGIAAAVVLIVIIIAVIVVKRKSRK
ncbi:DUF916 and DUF3324 domain-containing protein [Vagococcus elongatus]|uniref:Uncharacterized protein n=1 Tax=Vagococcus elongatus TaxID=180344 RepID=A0A430ANE1_9ENTE|nr:DUF916 and DUF3324 domain-containing protein [Vagococcus elongatus]RSU09585.1 hypothetical protein CBF29_11310 [Vagococcus elongatus]